LSCLGSGDLVRIFRNVEILIATSRYFRDCNRHYSSTNASNLPFLTAAKHPPRPSPSRTSYSYPQPQTRQSVHIPNSRRAAAAAIVAAGARRSLICHQIHICYTSKSTWPTVLPAVSGRICVTSVTVATTAAAVSRLRASYGVLACPAALPAPVAVDGD